MHWKIELNRYNCLNINSLVEHLIDEMENGYFLRSGNILFLFFTKKNFILKEDYFKIILLQEMYGFSFFNMKKQKNYLINSQIIANIDGLIVCTNNSKDKNNKKNRLSYDNIIIYAKNELKKLILVSIAFLFSIFNLYFFIYKSLPIQIQYILNIFIFIVFCIPISKFIYYNSILYYQNTKSIKAYQINKVCLKIIQGFNVLLFFLLTIGCLCFIFIMHSQFNQ